MKIRFIIASLVLAMAGGISVAEQPVSKPETKKQPVKPPARMMSIEEMAAQLPGGKQNVNPQGCTDKSIQDMMANPEALKLPPQFQRR